METSPSGTELGPVEAVRQGPFDYCRFINSDLVCWNEGDPIPTVDPNPESVRAAPGSPRTTHCRHLDGQPPICWGRVGWLRYDDATTTALGGVPYLHEVRAAPHYSSADLCRFIDEDPVCWKQDEAIPGRDPDPSNITRQQGPEHLGTHCRPVGSDQLCWWRPDRPSGLRSYWPSGAWRPFGVDGVLCRFIEFRAVCWVEGDELPTMDHDPRGVFVGPVSHDGAPCRVFAGHRICWEAPRDDVSPGDFRFVQEVPTEVPPGTVEGDRAALIALYDSTNGRRWRDDGNWRTETPIEAWHGITTDADGRVTELNLSANGLRGAIPPELGNLTELRSLRLNSNSLAGRIPPELGNLTKLRGLDLAQNTLSGGIPPELGGLVELRGVSLNSNRLTGSIPPEVGSLTQLVELYLHQNQLTGEIPPELGNLIGLEELLLGDNELRGAIPVELGGLTRLTTLALYRNELSGPIPLELSSLPRLSYLLLGQNQLTGTIPPALGDLIGLEALNLGHNQLTGEIPTEIGNITGLHALSLQENQLSGEIPPELGNLRSLRQLYLHMNQLTGQIPEALTELSLREFEVGGNQLTGCIPGQWWSERQGLPPCAQ